MLRHAVVGTGFGLNYHMPAFNAIDGVEVVAVTDSGSGRAQGLVTGPCLAFGDWRVMLDQVKPDSISVAAPPQYHKDIVVESLARGVHVYCEKPFGLSLQDAEIMCDAQAKAKAKCIGSVGFQYRYERGISLMRQLIQRGDVGGLRRIDVSWITSGRADPARPWSWQHSAVAGGGVINAFFSHVLDFAPWLAQSQLAEISGLSRILVNQRKDLNSTIRQVTSEDMVDTLGSFDSGVVFSARVTNCQSEGPGMKIEAYGNLGCLTFHHQWPFTSEDASLVLVRDGQSISIDLGNADGDSRLSSIQLIVRDFICAVRNQGIVPDLPNFDDGLRMRRNIDKIVNVSGLAQL